MDGIRNGMYRALLALDKVCDYVPIVGSISNGIDALIKKYIEKNPIGEMPSADPKNRYFEHIKSKDNSRMVAGAIPLVGNAILGVKDINAAIQKHKESNAVKEVAAPVVNQKTTKDFLEEKKSLFNTVIKESESGRVLTQKIYEIACGLHLEKDIDPNVLGSGLTDMIPASIFTQKLTINGESGQTFRVLDLSQLDDEHKDVLRSWLGEGSNAAIESEHQDITFKKGVPARENLDRMPRYEENIYILKGGTAIILDQPKRPL